MEKSEQTLLANPPPGHITVPPETQDPNRNVYHAKSINNATLLNSVQSLTGGREIVFGSVSVASGNEFSQPQIPAFGFQQFYQQHQNQFYFSTPPPPPQPRLISPHEITPQKVSTASHLNGSLQLNLQQPSLPEPTSPSSLTPVAAQFSASPSRAYPDPEFASLRNQIVVHEKTIYTKDVEIARLKEDVAQLRGWNLHLQQQVCRHEMAMQQRQRQGKGEEMEEVGKMDRIANSLAVNSLFASPPPPPLPVEGTGLGKSGGEVGVALMPPGLTPPGLNSLLGSDRQHAAVVGHEGSMGSNNAVAAAAEESVFFQPSTRAGPVDFNRSNSGSVSTLTLQNTLMATAVAPLASSWGAQAVSSIWSSFLGRGDEVEAVAVKTAPVPVPAVAAGLSKSVTSAAEFLNDVKEFIPRGYMMEEGDGQDGELDHLKSIWEVHDDEEEQQDMAQLVDRIIRNQDQPASILLQQKLKTVINPSVRAEIQSAILEQSLNLIRNRFGNFLVQRCLEVGSPDEIHALTTSMLGCIVILSCDRFGCHVVQKALDVCSDDLKVCIVNELLVAITDTVTHRFSCHVWQRVFETKWALHPYPATSTRSANAALVHTEDFGESFRLLNAVHPVISIVRRMDAALKGTWHRIANEESGSLVVQCVFENCPEVEKRGVIGEVLLHASEIARGQWGNWVIQHLLDRGYPPDKAHILEVVSTNIHLLSMDQFASKVVEKALKTCPKRELFDIVERVVGIAGESERPAIIDMMNNQYANYVVQHILTLAEPHQRDECTRLIAPHLLLLRSSKYGQRVAAIIEKNLRVGGGIRASEKYLLGGGGGFQSGVKTNEASGRVVRSDGTTPIYSQYFSH
ncbi:hypothetical protein HDU98_009726 [Podochytrium sp. JEL0797]|nr:hypothetical protein HDU98_009726 [Podochytrium sp. JEL0797]